MTQNRIHKPAVFLLTALLALPTATGHAAITSRQNNQAHPRGWSAVEGTDSRAVRERASHMPMQTPPRADQPWCARDAEIETTLRLDFREEKIARDTHATALWGSERRGTWTMVLERSDEASCVIASGIGFSRKQDPRVYFTTVGLDG